MANFNLADYETVDSRIKRFYTDHPEGRITTELVESLGEVGKTRWLVKASVFRQVYEDYDMARSIRQEWPDSTGYAFENDGEGMANRTSALENCETSAIGRALANLGYSGDKRASREEMTKAAPDPRLDPVLVADWVETLSTADSISRLQTAWEGAGKAGVTSDPRVIAAKDLRKKELA